MSMETEVASAAKRLDKDFPGWHKKVKRNNLDMGCADSCVLGQITGSAWDVEEKYCNRAFGLDAQAIYLDAGEKEEKLTTLWKQEIKKRRD